MVRRELGRVGEYGLRPADYGDLRLGRAYYWKTPCRYMTSGALFGFLFHSDFSEIGEGVYVDDMNLMRADVTVESDSYASVDNVHPGDSITLNYHIHNPAPFAVQCGLGARIAGIDAPVGYSDAANDTVVTIPSGDSWQTRTFTVQSGIPPEFGAPDGLYNMHSRDLVRHPEGHDGRQQVLGIRRGGRHAQSGLYPARCARLDISGQRIESL